MCYYHCSFDCVSEVKVDVGETRAWLGVSENQMADA